MNQPHDLRDLRASTAYDRSGEKIGAVADVYLDDATGQPAWVTVQTGLFGSRVTFAPMRSAELRGEQLILAVDKALVLEAPSVEADEHLGQTEESALAAYYYHAGSDPMVPTDAGARSADVATPVGDVLRTDRPAGDFVNEADLDTVHDDAGRVVPAAGGRPAAAERPFQRANGTEPDNIGPAKPTA